MMIHRARAVGRVALFVPLVCVVLFLMFKLWRRHRAHLLLIASVPVEAPVRGHGQIDFTALCREPEIEDGLSLCAYDGTTFSLLWQTDPVSGPEVHLGFPLPFGVAGGSGVIADGRGVLHVYDLGSGVETAQTTLGERALAIYAPREEPGKLWILTERERGLLFDAERLAVTEVAAPQSCVEWACSHNGRLPREIRCPKLADLLPYDRLPATGEVLAEGPRAVVIRQELGSDARTLLGFASKQEIWNRPVSPGGPPSESHGPEFLESSALSGGRVVVEYADLEHRGHVVAIDASSSATLWDVAGSGPVTLTSSRVYLGATRKLTVLDAATGSLLGSVGPD